jgi:spermidine synthase
MHKAVLRTLICVSILCQLPVICAAFDSEWGQLIYQKDSLYHRILVYKRGSIVTLRFGRQPAVQIQSQVDLNNLRQDMLSYTRLAFCGLLYEPQPKRMLVLGLGGGVIPREMHYYFPALVIDIAEIDPEILKTAEQFFGFREDDRLRVHIADGRMFIREHLRSEPVEKYDIIVLDAFNSDYIPFHLMTKEFLEQVKGVLAEDGVVVANVFQNNRLFDAELATFLAVFGRCQVFVDEYSTNAMLVSPGPKGQTLAVDEAVSRARTLQRTVDFAFDMVNVASRLRTNIRPEAHIKVLTDDRAPVNRLRTQERRKSP